MFWINIKGWVAENIAWLGFWVMCTIGSVVGHIKAYEASNTLWPVKKHAWDLVRRACYGGFIALVVAFTYKYFGLSQEVAFVMTGILSVFGSESIDFMYEKVKERISKKANDGR